MIRLLHWYCHIPLYFCFSIIFSTLLIHHHTPHWHNLPCDTCEPLWPLRHDAHPHWTLYHLHHQPGIAYQMDRWPTDLTATFPFLGRSHAVSLMLIPVAHYQFCTTLCDISDHRLTSHKSLHHMVSESEGFVVISPQMSLALNVLIINLYLITCIYYKKKEVFHRVQT